EALTNLVPVWVSDLPEVLEADGDGPQRLDVPCGVSGRISTENETDSFLIHAAKGQRFIFEVEARRLGSALDPILSLEDAKGKELASNDDAVGKDSRLEWEAPEAGSYTLLLRDLNNRGGPEFVYHLTLRRQQPDFTLECDGDKAQIAPGGGTAWYVKVKRS